MLGLLLLPALMLVLPLRKSQTLDLECATAAAPQRGGGWGGCLQPPPVWYFITREDRGGGWVAVLVGRKLSKIESGAFSPFLPLPLSSLERLIGPDQHVLFLRVSPCFLSFFLDRPSLFVGT